jgi:hypothetical protein
MTTREKYTYLKLMISNIRGKIGDGAHRTVVRHYQFDVGSETAHRIKVKEPLFDDAYLSNVVGDRKSWFTPMEVRDLIHHQVFFTANRLGCQPTTS